MCKNAVLDTVNTIVKYISVPMQIYKNLCYKYTLHMIPTTNKITLQMQAQEYFLLIKVIHFMGYML